MMVKFDQSIYWSMKITRMTITQTKSDRKQKPKAKQNFKTKPKPGLKKLMEKSSLIPNVSGNFILYYGFLPSFLSALVAI